jgi:hypothetical protein
MMVILTIFFFEIFSNKSRDNGIMSKNVIPVSLDIRERKKLKLPLISNSKEEFL